MPTESHEFYGQRFDWDVDKNLTNIEKHGIPFKEAATVFRDENAVFLEDKDHSEDEDRFHIIGLSGNLKLLIVCHCYREHENNSTIRIISARKATDAERSEYGGRR